MLALVSVYVHRWYVLLGVTTFSIVGFLFGYILLFMELQLVLSYPILFLVGIVLVFLLGNAYHYATEDAGHRRLARIASQYLARDLIDRVTAEHEVIRLGGERRTITVFFSDIQGFTTMSEEREPEEVVRFLNVYLRHMSDLIMGYQGYINKYEGDAIMAIWGAFRIEERQTELACIAALEQQARINTLAKRFHEEFGIDIHVRMGIHRGPAIVGNIGSLGKKIEFTAIGDTVNAASRLEGANKIYNTLISASEAVYEQTNKEFVYRRLDRIRVKGKTISVTIYELCGRVGRVSDDQLRFIKSFEIGLDAYFTRDFSRAYTIFAMLAQRGDAPSILFTERAKQLIETGVPEDWDGVYEATTK